MQHEFYVQATEYLNKCNIRIGKKNFRERMQSHPNYPSLLSLTDTLDELGIRYKAVVIDKVKYSELQYPLLAHIEGRNGVLNDFRYVKSATMFADNPALLESWDGISIIVDKSQNVNNSINKQQVYDQGKIKVLYSALFLFYIFLQYYTVSISNSIVPVCLGTLSIVGVLISYAIVSYGFGRKSAISEQLCKNDDSKGCEAVLKSKISAINPLFNIADLSLIYFLTLSLYIFAFLNTPTLSSYFSFLTILGTFGIVIAAVSIIIQWTITKAWCKMCLMVSCILLLQFITLGISDNLSISHISKYSTIQFSAIFLVLFIVWLLVRPILANSEIAIWDRISMLKWQRNPVFFFRHLKAQRRVSVRLWHDDIILGNVNSPVQIVVACNPYCKPCASSHKYLHLLLERRKADICLIIRFAINSTSVQNQNNVAVNSIINATQKHDPVQVIEDWFTWMNLEKFEEKYNVNTTSDLNPVLLKYHEWTKDTTIDYTPTTFINGFELQKPYSISMIETFLADIAEEFASPLAMASV